MDTTFLYLKKTLVLTVFVIFGFVVTYVPQSYPNQQNVPEAEAFLGGIVVDLTNLVQNTITAIASLGLQVKEYILDAIGWALSKSIVANMVADTVRWINKGIDNPYGGKDPVFVQELDKFLRNVGDQHAAGFLGKLGDDEWSYLCSPFKLDIQTALAQEYNETIREGKPAGQAPAGPDSSQSCDLDKVENLEEFIGGDFSAGGWDDWFEVTGNTSKYTQYGQYMAARQNMLSQIRAGQEQEQKVLDWGNGFQSIKKCKSDSAENSLGGSAASAAAGSGAGNSAPATPSSDPNSARAGTSAFLDGNSPYALTLDANVVGTEAPTSNILQEYEAETAANNPSANSVGGSAAASGATASPSSGSLGGSLATAAVQDCKIVTPGALIVPDLSQKLGSGIETLLNADELNEFIGTLLGQLANKALSGASGLLGLTEGGEGSYLNQMTREAQQQVSDANNSTVGSLNNLEKKREMEVVKQTQNSMSITATQYEDAFRNAMSTTDDAAKRRRIEAYIAEADLVGKKAAGHEQQIQTEYIAVFDALEREFNDPKTSQARKVAIRAEQEAKYTEYKANLSSYYTEAQLSSYITRWQSFLDSL
jgi:hypothetical protein